MYVSQTGALLYNYAPPPTPTPPFNNSAPLGGAPTPHPRWTPPPFQRLGQIFFRAFGQAKFFGAFGAN